jgi:hypothetical protein
MSKTNKNNLVLLHLLYFVFFVDLSTFKWTLNNINFTAHPDRMYSQYIYIYIYIKDGLLAGASD